MGNGKSRNSLRNSKPTIKYDESLFENTEDESQHHLIINIIDSEFGYLCRFKSELEIFSIKNIDNILKHLFVLSTQIGNEDLKSDILKLAHKHNIENFFVPALTYCIQYVNEYFSELFRTENQNLEIIGHVWKASKLFILCLSFLDYLLDHPTIVTQKFHTKNLTKVLLNYLSDEVFLRNCISFAEIGYNHKYSIQEDFSEMLMIALHNMSKIAAAFPEDFEDLKIKKIVFKYISYVKSLHRHDKVLRGYLILANILNEEDFFNIEETSIIIESIMKLLRNTAKQLSKGKKIDRRRISIDPTHEVKDNVTFITDKSDYEWNSIEIMLDLYNLVVHDSLKSEIYYKYDAKNVLIKIIMNGNETEKQYSMKLLWQLCFHDSVSNDISKSHKLIEYVTRLSQDSSTHIRLKMKCFGLLWMIKRKILAKTIHNNDLVNHLEKSQNLNEAKHIMISYNHESRELVSKIKDFLENSNHKVWMNTENTYMHDLETTIRAIDDSTCVIICFTEEYKRSNFCRTEAEHAAFMRKRCISITLQKHFKLDGWVNKIIPSHVPVDFTNLAFDLALNNLLKEIENITEPMPELIPNDINLDLSNNSSLDFTTEKENGSVSVEITNHQYKKPIIIFTNDDFSENDQVIEDKNKKEFHHKRLYTIEESPTVEVECSFEASKNKIDEIGSKKKIILSTCCKWSNEQVSQWVETHDFCEDIKNFLKNFDGQVLKQLYLTKREAPEYFYKTISNDSKIHYEYVAKFLIEFSTLFSDMN